MKIFAVAIVVLALVVGIVPQFTDCHSQGRVLTLESGKTVDMKCHWTAMAQLGLALPTLAVGSFMGFGKQKESRRMLAGAGVVLGAVVMLLPTALIGVCANPDMLCNSVMRPVLLLAGGLVLALSAGYGLLTFRQRGDA
jgi:hypothetical protein